MTKILTLQLVNVRDAPNGTKIGTIPLWTFKELLDGPFNVANLIWWKVQDGFIAEATPDKTPLFMSFDDSKFDYAMGFIFHSEGGYVDDKFDVGGRTLYGIAQKFNPDVDVSLLSLSQAKEIYRKKYWGVAENIEDKKLALTVFDCSVNCGSGTAANMLINNQTFDEYNNARRLYYKSLKQFERFGQGWLSRINNIEEYVKIMNV